MIYYLTLLGIFTLHAHAAVHRPSPTQQSVIMAHIRTALDARNDANAVKFRMDNSKSDPEAWEQLSKEEEAYRKTAATAFELAIKKTPEFYGISPGGLQIGESAIAKQGPMMSAAIPWAPAVLDANHLSYKYTDSQGATRYEAAAANGTAGQTFGDGQVRINITMFELAVLYDHPGSLAYVLHHESQHFEEKVSRQERSREESEISAYQQSLLSIDVFEMGKKGPRASTTEQLASKADWASAFKARSAQHAADLSAGLGRSVYMTPAEELAAKGVFEVDEKELARIQAETAGLKLAAARIRIAREELLRKEAAAAEAKRQLMADYKAAASSCGLTPMMTAQDQTLGFKDAQSVNVFFTEPVTLDQAKAGLLMTRACLFGEFGQPEDQPCTDALVAMRANWGDAGFKHGLELDADAGNIDGCLRAIRDNGDAPKDMRALNKRVASYWKDWKVAAKRREMETRREYWRQQEETGRTSRRDAEERSGRVPDQNYDLTAPRRALDEARRSHF